MTTVLMRRRALPLTAILLVGFAPTGLLTSPVSGSTAPTCGSRIATIVGTSGSDEINGTSGSDVIVGLGGSDDIEGNGGNDVICGNRGNDELEGDRGSDRLYGGLGYDEAEGGPGADVCRAEEIEGC
jgi:Ca2+-binding RTX toxin-like protein